VILTLPERRREFPWWHIQGRGRTLSEDRAALGLAEAAVDGSLCSRRAGRGRRGAAKVDQSRVSCGDNSGSRHRAEDYEARRRRVRAAFRAALCVMPMRLRVAAPRFAAARGERWVPRRRRAELFAWRDSEERDAALRPSLFITRRMARLRFGDDARGLRLPRPAS